MNTKTRITALVLCAALLILPLLSCNVRMQDDAPPPAPVLTITDNGVSDYVIVTEDSGSDIYLEALEVLRAAVAETFGVVLPTVSPSDYADTEGVPFYEKDDAKVIFFGNPDVSHKALERAKESLSGKGFSVLCEGSALALYAESDICIRDLADLFAQKYVRNMKGDSFTVDRSISLLRPFDAFTSEDGTEYNLTLPVISVQTENDEPVLSLTRYVRASVSVLNTYREYALDGASAEIRGRGNGTWDTTSSDKLPYKLKFDEKTNLLGVGRSADRDWALLSNPLDASQLRNTLAFTLTQKVFTNIKYCTGFAYANLFLSGEYMGVYLICEQAEASGGRINVDESTGECELSEYLIELDYYATKSSNGYTRDVDYFKVADKYWVIKSDYNSAERCEYVKQKFQALMDAIERGDEDAIRSMVDMESCVDMYLLHEYTKNTDVGWSSFYMILNRDGVIEFVWPWDFDLSSGNDNRIDNSSYEGLHAGDYETLEKQSNPIFYNLMRLDFFKEEVAARWAHTSELADSVLLESAEYYANRHAFDFACDFAFNYGSRKHPDLVSVSSSARRAYLSNVSRLEEWFAGRRLWLDGYFADYLQ